MVERVLKVIAGEPKKPLVIAGVKIQAYVLEDEIRVLSQRGFLGALDRSRSLRGGVTTNPLPPFLLAQNLEPFLTEGMRGGDKLVRFTAPDWGGIGVGYRAELLPEVCGVYLDARAAGALRQNQLHVARRAEILLRALATVGIIALVDEATGYQQTRERRALAKILEKYLSDEYKPWSRTFPFAFYKEIVRLQGWPDVLAIDRPGLIGHITNDVVYERVAPGVLVELQRRNPMLPTGERSQRHHQWFDPDFGLPKLREHIASVTALMRASRDWASFMHRIDAAFPKLNAQLPLGYAEDYEGPSLN